MDRRDYFRNSTAGLAGWLGLGLADAAGAAPLPLQEATRHVFNVRDPQFGADGTGGADDTTPIQRAIDQAASEGSGIVFLPAGRYLVTGLVLRSGVTVSGAGMTLGDRTGSGTIVQAIDKSVTRVFEAGDTEYASIKHLKIIGSSPAQQNTIGGIDCTDDATYFHVHMVSVRYCGGTALRLRGGVNRVEFLRTRNCWGPLIELAGHDSHIMFCDIGSTDRRRHGGIVVTGHQNTLLANNVFNCRTGIWLQNGNRNRVLGNRCEKHGYYGIEINSYENNVISNQCWNNGIEAKRDGAPSAGIALLNRSANTVVGNELFNLPSADDPVQDIGVLVQGTERAPAAGNIVANNVVRECHLEGIRLAGHTHDTCVSNNLVQLSRGINEAVGIHLLAPARDNQILGNNLARQGESDGGFTGIRIASDTCVDNVVSDNVVHATPEQQLLDSGVHTRINGTVFVRTRQERDRLLTSGQLEPGRMVHDEDQKRSYLTTRTGSVRLG